MFIPVIIIVSILFVITVLLSIADSLLVSYGTCNITLKEEGAEREFSVQGGGTLLSALIDNNVKIAASCGGRGSCGFCKCQLSEGGGEMLPTEELYISKDERKLGTRLACQVKVKEDIRLYIPDLLTSVKYMVKSGTFDTKLRWRFVKVDKPQVLQEAKKEIKLDKKELFAVQDIVEKHKTFGGAIMPVLQEVNEKYRFLPEPVLKVVAEELDIPLSVVFRIATFYNAFSLVPRGKHIISVCMGTACHVKGAADILSSFEEQLKVQTGETTEDTIFTVQAVRCIGCCGLAPVITVNEDVHGHLKKQKVAEIIERYKGA
jgi:NADP-reducing hydrogenase subunit HndA